MITDKCSFCGVVEHIDLLDGAPLSSTDHEFLGLGCVRCYAREFVSYQDHGQPIRVLRWSAAGEDDSWKELSVAPELREWYEQHCGDS